MRRDVLARLVAEEEIRLLLARLPQAFDRRDLPATAGSLAEDAELTWDRPAARLRGRADVEAALVERWDRWQATASYAGNLAIAWEGDVAVATSYLQCWVWQEDTRAAGERRPADRVRVWAVEDLLREGPDGWRIVRRRHRALGPGGVGL